MTKSVEDARETPLEDHIKYAIKRMRQGARMILDAIPNDSSLSSASFGPNVTAEIARRLSALASLDTPSNEVRADGGCGYCNADQGESHRPDCTKPDREADWRDAYREK